MSLGHNTEFLRNPIAYLGTMPVLTIGTKFSPNETAFQTQVAKPLIYMDLVVTDSGVKSGARQARADFCVAPPGGDGAIAGAWIPYVDEGTVLGDTSKLPAQELPAGGVPSFAFTGAMNGCSLVLATKGGKSYGIHVPNSKQATQNYPVLAKEGYTYVKSIDYHQMGQLNQGFYGTAVGAGPEAPGGGWYNTFAFFYYTGGVWTIVAQRQIVTARWLEGDTRAATKMDYRGAINGAVVQV